jgi:hypothetical protein
MSKAKKNPLGVQLQAKVTGFGSNTDLYRGCGGKKSPLK